MQNKPNKFCKQYCYLCPKCQTHACRIFQSNTKKVNILFASLCRLVLGKTVPLVLGAALGLHAVSGRRQDLDRSLFQYGLPGRQITWTYCPIDSVQHDCKLMPVY